MSLKKSLGKVAICLFLEVGAMCGVPIRPEEIEELMKMNQPKIVQVVRNDDGEGTKHHEQ
jgi:hypothetical protein